jgi:hypothetical protein
MTMREFRKHVVAHHDDFHGQVVLDRCRELGHQHRKSAVTDDRDDLTPRIGQLRRDRVRQPRCHGGEHASGDQLLSATQSQEARREMRVGSAVLTGQNPTFER